VNSFSLVDIQFCLKKISFQTEQHSVTRFIYMLYMMKIFPH